MWYFSQNLKIKLTFDIVNIIALLHLFISNQIHTNVIHLCTCTLFLMMVEWNDRNVL